MCIFICTHNMFMCIYIYLYTQHVCVYIYIYIWGCDYQLTNYKFKRNLNFENNNLNVPPLAIYLRLSGSRIFLKL